jgi:uncharacterized protein YpuA (DUF1002 family)
MAKKKTNHWFIRFLISMFIGVATKIFIDSKQGQKLSRDLETKAMKLQDQIAEEIKNKKNLTKEKYEEVVNMVMKQYANTTKVAQTEIPILRKFLMQRWSHIQKTMRS